MEAGRAMKPKQAGMSDCERCPHRGLSVLCDVTGEELAAFQQMKRTQWYEPRQTVFFEGHPCLGLYLLCQGKVKLTRSSPRGQRQIVRILDGSVLIEKHAFKNGAIHEVTCETIERSQVCIIDKTAYWTLVRRNSDLAVKLIQLLAGELDAGLDQLDQFTFKTARQRLASLLLDLAERFGRRVSDQVRIEITLKREELAELAGVTIETAIRQLNAFREEGLITVQGRQIAINDAERLGRVARC